MNKLVLEMEKRFNAFSLRERILICVTLLVSLYFVWHIILYNYFLATDEEISRQTNQIRSQISLLEGQIDSISEVLGRNPTAALADQVENLKKENEILNQKILHNTKKMISSKDMATVLEDLISKTDDLIIVNIQSLGTKPLFSDKSIMEDGKNVQFQVYNHGLKIEMVGGYFETLNFLKRLEKKNMNVIWDEIHYEVKEYPKAKIVIILHTLNLDEGWIGV